MLKQRSGGFGNGMEMIMKFLSRLFKRRPEWYEPADPTPREQCPCCDYISLPERNNYLICPICFWEDDGQDLDELEKSSVPNQRITLREGRQNFLNYGACTKDMLKNVIKPEERGKCEHRPRQTK